MKLCSVLFSKKANETQHFFRKDDKKYGICKNKNGFEIGDWATTTKKVDSCAGYFEKGTKVKVIGKSYRGYDLEDEYGNRVIETGYDSIG